MKTTTILKAIIFDMDGLMVDTEKLYWDVLSEIAMSTSNKVLTESTMSKMMGRAPIDSMRLFKEDLMIPITAEELLSQRDILMVHKLQSGVDPMKGLYEIINQFHGRLKLAIATGSPQCFLDIIVDKLGIRNKFTVFQASDEIIQGKPHPEIFLQTADKLQLKPEECIILEDSLNGVLAGLNAGCYVIAVPSKYLKDQDFSAVNFIAGDLTEAQEHILALIA
jgi:HAD superfamily hydrolase (TIGR01509 family)